MKFLAFSRRAALVSALAAVTWLNAQEAPAAPATAATPAQPAQPPQRPPTIPVTPGITDAKLFAYDASRSLDVKVVGEETRGSARVQDITYVGTTDPIRAYIVSPAQTSGSHAAILYVHWFGGEETTNRTQFLEEAIALADRGVISVLVDTQWSKPKWWENRTLETDRDAAIAQVIELRRAMDLLVTQPGVDRKRIAIVGHDFGAMFGSVMGAADGRAKTFVLLAPTPRISNWYLLGRKLEPAAADAYRASFFPLDPVEWAAQLAPASVFFQFASKDGYVPARHAWEFYGAALPRKVMATYDTNHEMHLPAVGEDRVAWLARELELK